MWRNKLSEKQTTPPTKTLPDLPPTEKTPKMSSSADIPIIDVAKLNYYPNDLRTVDRFMQGNRRKGMQAWYNYLATPAQTEQEDDASDEDLPESSASES